MGSFARKDKTSFDEWFNTLFLKSLVPIWTKEYLKEAWEKGYEEGFADADFIHNLNLPLDNSVPHGIINSVGPTQKTKDLSFGE